MAIVKSHPRISVEIYSNSAPLQEYVNDEEEDAPNAVTKYIEAASGAEFEVRCTLTRDFPETTLMCQVYLDGKRAAGMFCEQSFYVGESARLKLRGVSHSDGSGSFVSNFCFSSLAIDDSDLSSAGDELLQTLKKMGEISVKVYRVENLRGRESENYHRKELSTVGTIPEKALKGRALTHSVGLRAPQPATKRTIMDCDYIDRSDQPLLTFNFRYRSREALKALLIIPRSPSPLPLEQRDVDTLTPEEMRELLKRQRERQEAAGKVKVEGIKRERARVSSPIIQGDNEDVSFVSEKRRKLNISIDEFGSETIDLT